MSIKSYILAAIAATLALTAPAAIPTSYYKSLDGKSGQALKNAVHDIVVKHTVLNYNSLWSYFPDTDCMPDNRNRVWDMYSDQAYYFAGYGKSTYGMNREHSLPKSWWGGNVNEAYTDLNHLYPADGDANMAKSNYPLGEVSKATFNNGVTKVGSPVAGQGGGASVVFEPDNRYKGDFARTYFYMATCYQHLTWKYNYMLNNNTWLTLNPWSIDLLLKWSRQDPVSDKEKARNEAVYRSQNNRNPFIDNPDLAEYIWGNKASQPFVAGGDLPTGDAELMSPAQNSQFNFGEVAIGQSLTLTVYVKGVNLSNSLSVMIYRDNAEMFKSSVSSVDRTAAQTADGYPLVVTYTPTSLGTHTARLLVSDGGLVGSVGCELKGTCLPVPDLKGVEALEATEITDSSYVANWAPIGDEQIDCYMVTRTITSLDGTFIRSEETLTDDGETTSMQFNDRRPGEIHSYSVRSCRLQYWSDPSNTIHIDNSGITGVEADRPAAFIVADGAVLVKCCDPLQHVSIFSPSGTLIRHIDKVYNDDVIELPAGVYIVTSQSSTRPVKIAIR